MVEGSPLEVGKRLTEALKVPTIGIGAGPYCDGQVLVVNDMLGLYDAFTPKFVKKYAHLAEDMKKAFKDYVKDVKEEKFPEDKHCFH